MPRVALPAQPLVRSKLRTPAVAGRGIPRPRVQRALEDAARGRSILLVVASAGSGKTTAVVQFAATRPGPRAWLTLGEADDSPGRFVTYLAAAIASADPAAAARAQALLDDGARPVDCAAILGEDLPPEATVVIDDLHHIERRASVLRVLRAFLDAVAEGALVVLASRRAVDVDVGRHVLADRSGAIDGRALAFRAGEVSDLLAAHGLPGVAEEIQASSAGWAAGIVFEAMRAERPDSAVAAPEDPFFAYLGSEVLSALPGDLRHTVLRSALLDVVSAEGIEALLAIPSARTMVEAIAAHQLPAVREPEGLRYHPRFREFLLSVLGREHPDEMRVLTARHARTLLADGHAEEAADALLEAGEVDEAATVIESAAIALLQRGDWDKVLSWCAALDEGRLARSPALRGHQLRALLNGRRNDDMAAIVHRMRATGEFDRLVTDAPEAAMTALWALHVGGAWRSLLDLVPPDEASPAARAMRHIFEVGSADGPAREWTGDEIDRLAPDIALAQCGFHYSGHLAHSERYARSIAGHGPIKENLAEVYRISSLTARGDLAEARRLFDATAHLITASGFGDFWAHTEGELVFAEGRREEGLRLVGEARRMAGERGHEVADRAIFAATEGKMLVRTGMLADAVAALAAAREWCIERELPGFREWADTWLAGALLARGDPPEGAATLLSEAIEGMERARRRLELPAAHALMAEARWRAGDEAGHDASADAAYATAVAMGSLGPLLTALEQVPDVLARRIAAGDGDDDTWKALARAGAATDAAWSPAGARVVVRTFGRAALEVGGAEVAVSPPKAIELAAAVARAGTRGATRLDLVDALFDESADGANYLRQLVHRLRRALPPDVTLAFEEGRLSWSPAGAVVSEEQVLEGLIARSRREVGDERLAAIADALEIVDRGAYLPGVEGHSARDERERIDALVAAVRREGAQLLIAAGRPTHAVAAARAAVTADPYREDGWQLLMRAEAAARGPAAAVPAFLECSRALAEVGMTPSRRMRGLLDRLRGAPEDPPGGRVLPEQAP